MRKISNSSAVNMDRHMYVLLDGCAGVTAMRDEALCRRVATKGRTSSVIGIIGESKMTSSTGCVVLGCIKGTLMKNASANVLSRPDMMDAGHQILLKQVEETGCAKEYYVVKYSQLDVFHS